MCAKDHDNLKLSEAKQWANNARLQGIWINYHPHIICIGKNFSSQ